MPLLGRLLSGLFIGLVEFLLSFLTRRLTILGAYVATMSALTGALLVAFNGWVAPLAAQLFNTELGQFLGLAFPPVAGDCMAIMGSCWAACTLYAWQSKAAAMVAKG